MVIAAGDLIYNDCITSSSTWEGRPSYLALKILWDLGSCNPSSGYSAFLLLEFRLLKTSGVKGVFLLFPPASPLFPHAPGLFLLFFLSGSNSLLTLQKWLTSSFSRGSRQISSRKGSDPTWCPRESLEVKMFVFFFVSLLLLSKQSMFASKIVHDQPGNIKKKKSPS